VRFYRANLKGCVSTWPGRAPDAFMAGNATAMVSDVRGEAEAALADTMGRLEELEVVLVRPDDLHQTI
jgi:hypothetical protein